MSNDIINLDVLGRLLKVIGGDPEDLAELVEDYTAGAPTLVDRMRDGAGSSDWVVVYQSAHTLKSNARDMGALQLSELCAALEKEAREGPVDMIEVRVTEIASEEEAARQALLSIWVSDIPDD